MKATFVQESTEKRQSHFPWKPPYLTITFTGFLEMDEGEMIFDRRKILEMCASSVPAGRYLWDWATLLIEDAYAIGDDEDGGFCAISHQTLARITVLVE